MNGGLGSNPSPDSFLGLAEVVGEVSVQLTGCSGRAAAAAYEITQGEIVTGTMAFTQGAASTVGLCFSHYTCGRN